MGKFGEGANSELSTFLFLFFFLRNFFFPTADDFTILGGGGEEILAFAPPPQLQVPHKNPTFHKKPELQSFLKMRWRLLPSQPKLPLPQSPALSPGQGGPARLGGDPKHILPLTVMLQKLKTHLRAGCPPSVSSQEVAEEDLGLSSVPRVKDAWKPWTSGWQLSPTTHTKPQSQGSLNIWQNPRSMV